MAVEDPNPVPVTISVMGKEERDKVEHDGYARGDVEFPVGGKKRGKVLN